MGMFSVGKEIACETVLITDANPAGKRGRSWERHIQIVSFHPSNVPVTKGVEQLLLLLITVRIVIFRLSEKPGGSKMSGWGRKMNGKAQLPFTEDPLCGRHPVRHAAFASLLH